MTRPIDEIEVRVPARHDEDHRRQRQLAVVQHQRFDVTGQVMDGDQRQAGRRGRGLGERHADEERPDQAGTPASRRSPPGRSTSSPRHRARARRTPQMSRICWREASSPARRRPIRGGWALATRPHWTSSPTASPRRQFSSTTARRRLVAGGFDPENAHTSARLKGSRSRCHYGPDGARNHRPTEREPFQASAFSSNALFSDSTYGGRKIPRSVMMPAMKRCGVTSNAGFQTRAPVGHDLQRADVRHFPSVALFDRDVVPVWCVEIDRRERRRDIKTESCVRAPARRRRRSRSCWPCRRLAAIRSAPTTTRSTWPWRIRAPLMLSVMTVV